MFILSLPLPVIFWIGRLPLVVKGNVVTDVVGVHLLLVICLREKFPEKGLPHQIGLNRRSTNLSEHSEKEEKLVSPVTG